MERVAAAGFLRRFEGAADLNLSLLLLVFPFLFAEVIITNHFSVRLIRLCIFQIGFD